MDVETGSRWNMLGEAVAEYQRPGSHLQNWDGRDQRGIPAASGTYFYRLELLESGLSESRSMSLVR